MLELKNITYEVKETIDGKENIKRILKGINLNILDGTFLVVTGPNGSGKSTLAKIIMGIIKPTSGQILFDGKDITNLSIDKRAKLGISFAFQQPIKFKGILVKDLLRLASGKETNISDACNFLSNVGLCARDYIDREVNDSLSGGELKRIEIATSEARGSKLSIFDEPEAGIDIWSFTSLVKVFENLMKKQKDNISIVISHQERLIGIADKVVLLESGEIKKIGKPNEILDSSLMKPSQCKRITEVK